MWVMDRGIPTEAILREMREPGREMFYLVGTPKGRINKHEKKWLDLPLLPKWFLGSNVVAIFDAAHFESLRPNS
jgi:hypothetical protein